MVRTRLRAGVVGAILGLTLLGVAFAQGPSPAQIQQAIRQLLASDAVVSGDWTCTGTCTGFDGGGGNPFNQDLNTSDSPTFVGLTLSGSLTGADWAGDVIGSEFLEPAGSTTQIQFNNAGALAASSGLVWSPTTETLTVTHTTADASASQTGLTIAMAGDGAGGNTALSAVVTASGPGVAQDLEYYTTGAANLGSVATLYIYREHGSSGTLGESQGIYIDSMGKGGGAGTITTNRAIYIEDQANATNSYSIYTKAGLVRLGDAVESTKYFTTAAVTSVTNTSANSCGTTAAALGTGSSNSAGTFTVGGTSGTDCTLTFSVAAPHFWTCGVSNTTTANLARAIPLSTTTTKVVGVFVAADVIQYSCNAF